VPGGNLLRVAANRCSGSSSIVCARRLTGPAPEAGRFVWSSSTSPWPTRGCCSVALSGRSQETTTRLSRAVRSLALASAGRSERALTQPRARSRRAARHPCDVWLGRRRSWFARSSCDFAPPLQWRRRITVHSLSEVRPRTRRTSERTTRLNPLVERGSGQAADGTRTHDLLHGVSLHGGPRKPCTQTNC
jgi:hypothetical protein